MENNIFEGIPSLDDTQGLENYAANQAASQAIGTPATTPQALTPNAQPATDPNAAVQPQVQGQVTYTQEDIQRIIAENAQYKAQAQARAQAQAQPQVQGQPQNVMPQQRVAQPNSNANPQPVAQGNPQLQMAIARALAAGYTPEQVYAAMKGNTAQAKLENRLDQIQNYLEQQQYQREEAAFIDKMTTFGNKWGLSEQDLVTFADKALQLGINVAQVNDVEAVFRAVYPEQYAFRAQRIANQNNASPIYGGTAFQEVPRAAQEKAADAYVENFLKNKMPNAYNRFTNINRK